MVEIISKTDGTRPEDARVKRLIQQNRATIERIADHLSNGSYSASKIPKPQMKVEGRTIVYARASAPTADDVRADVRVSLNGRIVAVDLNSGRQLHHIGDVRRRDGANVFVLATGSNGFVSPVDDEIAAALADLDGVPVDERRTEGALAAEIGRRLGVP